MEVQRSILLLFSAQRTVLQSETHPTFDYTVFLVCQCVEELHYFAQFSIENSVFFKSTKFRQA